MSKRVISPTSSNSSREGSEKNHRRCSTEKKKKILNSSSNSIPSSTRCENGNDSGDDLDLVNTSSSSANDSGILQQELAQLNEKYEKLLENQNFLMARFAETDKKKSQKITIDSQTKNLRNSAYNEGCRKDLSWNLNLPSPFAKENDKMTIFVRNHMKGYNGDLSDEIINASISQYFVSKKTMAKKKASDEKFKENAAAHQRLLNKCKRRSIALESMDIRDSQKDKVHRVLTFEYMSSEEEDENEEEERVFVVHPLKFRSQKLVDTFKRLDSVYKDTMNKRSKNQTVKRIQGRASTRVAPPDAPSYAIIQASDQDAQNDES